MLSPDAVLPVIHLICLILMRNLLTNVLDYFLTLQENCRIFLLVCLRTILPPDDREIKLSNITIEPPLFLELTNIHPTVAQYLTWSIVPVICPIDIRLKNLFRISSVWKKGLQKAKYRAGDMFSKTKEIQEAERSNVKKCAHLQHVLPCSICETTP